MIDWYMNNISTTKKILMVLGILMLAFLSTIMSITHLRTNPTVIGNLCDVTDNNPNGFCYKDLPAGGFPFSYLYDNGGVSVIGALGIEDEFVPSLFVINIISYIVFYLVIYLSWKKIIAFLRMNNVKS